MSLTQDLRHWWIYAIQASTLLSVFLLTVPGFGQCSIEDTSGCPRRDPPPVGSTTEHDQDRYEHSSHQPPHTHVSWWIFNYHYLVDDGYQWENPGHCCNVVPVPDGTPSKRHRNVVWIGSRLQPAEGYKWRNNKRNDYRVVRISNQAMLREDKTSMARKPTRSSVPFPPERHYRPSGNALIGGTSWIVGYNVQSANPAIIAKEKEMLRKQMELAHIPYDEAIDFEHYNFVLGIAASTSKLLDLKNRVIFDQFKNGQFSAQEQGLYNSLKDRQFGELACHSNGAMIGLAALKNEDIKADHVVLYGPQITRESLVMWNQLVNEGKVKSVQFYINKNDPVPPLSLSLGDFFLDLPVEMALLNSATLENTIKEISPSVGIHTFSCGNGVPTLDCHDMRAYKRDRH